jgi:hypothetical protein
LAGGWAEAKIWDTRRPEIGHQGKFAALDLFANLINTRAITLTIVVVVFIAVGQRTTDKGSIFGWLIGRGQSLRRVVARDGVTHGKFLALTMKSLSSRTPQLTAACRFFASTGGGEKFETSPWP